MQPDQIRQLVTATFAELGANEPEGIHRTLLLRGGYFVGQRFRCGDFDAILPADNSRIEFLGPDGMLLRTIDLDQPPKKQAA